VIALLARVTHEAGERKFAQRIGVAIDTNQRELTLGDDVLAALSVLEDCPEELSPLRGALLRQLSQTTRNSDAQVAKSDRRPRARAGRAVPRSSDPTPGAICSQKRGVSSLHCGTRGHVKASDVRKLLDAGTKPDEVIRRLVNTGLWTEAGAKEIVSFMTRGPDPLFTTTLRLPRTRDWFDRRSRARKPEWV
jgi:hypothetical protein